MLQSTSLAYRNDFDDEPTTAYDTIGDLVAAPPIVVSPSTSLATVRALLAEHRVPAIAVATASRLCGVVTRTDVLRGRDDDPDATASDAMSGFVFALPITSTIVNAAALMAYEGVNQIVVIGPSGDLVGIVSAVELVAYFVEAATR
jgi:CBS domain-containing protein